MKKNVKTFKGIIRFKEPFVVCQDDHSTQYHEHCKKNYTFQPGIDYFMNTRSSRSSTDMKFIFCGDQPNKFSQGYVICFPVSIQLLVDMGIIELTNKTSKVIW